MCPKHWIFKAVICSKATMAVANSAIFVTNEEELLTVKVLYFSELTQTDVFPSRCVEYFNELLSSCLPNVRPCSPGYTVHTWRSCAYPRVEELLALRNGQWRSRAVPRQLKGNYVFLFPFFC